jgi:hypothetical protein
MLDGEGMAQRQMEIGDGQAHEIVSATPVVFSIAALPGLQELRLAAARLVLGGAAFRWQLPSG